MNVYRMVLSTLRVQFVFPLIITFNNPMQHFDEAIDILGVVVAAKANPDHSGHVGFIARE